MAAAADDGDDDDDDDNNNGEILKRIQIKSLHNMRVSVRTVSRQFHYLLPNLLHSDLPCHVE